MLYWNTAFALFLSIHRYWCNYIKLITTNFSLIQLWIFGKFKCTENSCRENVYENNWKRSFISLNCPPRNNIDQTKLSEQNSNQICNNWLNKTPKKIKVRIVENRKYCTITIETFLDLWLKTLHTSNFCEPLEMKYLWMSSCLLLLLSLIMIIAFIE